MNHAGGIVERFVINHEARVTGVFEHLHQVAERDILLHGDDVGARQHDILNTALAQPEDVFEQRLLLRREAGFVAGALLQHLFEFIAGGAGLQTERAQQAIDQAFAVLRRVRRRSRRIGIAPARTIRCDLMDRCRA